METHHGTTSSEKRLLRINFRIKGLLREQLWAQVLLGLLLGAVVGVLLGPSVGWVEAETASRIAEWLALPGVIFIKLIKLIMVPLVFSSIMLGLLSSDSLDQLRRLGLRALLYFVGTTAVAIVIGLVLAYTIDPGAGFTVPAGAVESAAVPSKTLNFTSIPAFIGGMLPDNLLGVLVQAEMLGVIIGSILFGVAVFSLPPHLAQGTIRALGTIQELTMIIVGWSMRIAPFAVFGFLAQLTAKTGIESLQNIALYMLTVVSGLLLLFVMYSFILVLAGSHPLVFFSRIKEVMLLAFSTSSSAAVMPLSMMTAESKLGIRPNVAQFIIPVGATVNMAGTALYQGVAAVFLAQAFQIELSLPALVVMVVTVVLASIGTPATPGVGIIILATVLQQAGIPTEGIALILGVDRILDMCRTVLNVTGDLVGCVLFERWLAKH